MANQKNKKKERITENTLGYFPGLDILRFLCATGVIFHHTAELLFERGLVSSKSTTHEFSGAFFLNVFFIISGFLIGAILIKEIDCKKYSLKNFFARRIIRIWPLYFLIVALFIVLIPSAKEIPAETIKTNLFFASTFTINFQLLFNASVKTYSVLWSVCVEEHIYLLLPFFIFVFRHNFKWLAAFLIICGFSFWAYFGLRDSGLSPYYLTPSYFYYFGAGLLLAVYFPKIAEAHILFSKVLQYITLAFGLLYALHFFPNRFYVLPFWLVLCFIFGCYTVCCSMRNDFVFKTPASAARYLGNISYAMYMVHIFSINLLLFFLIKNHILPGYWAATFLIPVLATLISMVLSSVLFYFFERHILKLKTKFTSVKNK